MQSLVPEPIEILSGVEDGEAARHFCFRFCHRDNSNLEKWQDARPGQFFMLSVPGAGEAPFTFTTLPNAQGEFSALVRRMGQVTGALFERKPGAILGARGPFGHGWPVASGDTEKALIVGGGCGLAPLVSLVEHLINSGTPPVALVYGARTAAAQVLNPERKRWQSQLPLFDIVQQGNGCQYRGTPLDLLPEVLNQVGEPERVFLCGPEIMMHTVAELFVQRGLAASSIWMSIERRMHCATGTCGHCYLENQYVCKDGPTYRWDKLAPLLARNSGAGALADFHC